MSQTWICHSIEAIWGRKSIKSIAVGYDDESLLDSRTAARMLLDARQCRMAGRRR